MFTKKLALVLCVGAVLLLATAGANATITIMNVTTAGVGGGLPSYDLTGANVTDYFNADGAQNPAGDGSLALNLVYTAAAEWYGGINYDMTVNNMNPSFSYNWAQPLGAGPSITTITGTTTGFHAAAGAIVDGAGFAFGEGVAGRTLNFIMCISEGNGAAAGSVAVTGNDTLTGFYYGGNWTAQFYLVTADLPTTAGTVFFADPGIDRPSGGISTAWVTSPAPEPVTMALLAVGGIGVLLKRRRNV
jgi:hypothetical protein